MNNSLERIDYSFEDDLLERELHIKRYESVTKYAKIGNNILDIGCGLGWGTNFLSSKSEGNVIGVDIDLSTIRKAKKKYENIDFILCNASNLPFKDESFEIIVSIENIEHIENQVDYIKEIYRIATSSLIITTPNEGNLINRFVDIIGYKRTTNPYHVHEFTYAELIHLLESNNFKIVGSKGLYLRIIPPKIKTQIIRKFKFLIPVLVNFPLICLTEYMLIVCKKSK